MRMRGKVREVAPGVFSEWPTTKEEASARNLVYYRPLEDVEPCEHGKGSVFFTKTGIKKCCALDVAAKLFNEAMEAGDPCSPTDAFTRGYDYYWEQGINKQCGHPRKLTLQDRCYFCRTERKHTLRKKKGHFLSARQKAIAEGEKWYMPTEPCKNGHLALRRVQNGECKQCTEEAAIRSHVEPIWRSQPDMVISREDAIALGFTTYRTGEPCRRGHTAWRYISTGNCIACLGRE